MGRDVRELLRRPFDADQYRAILAEWKTHSVAEDARDIAGLISTLTPDCIYELPQLGVRWEGHAGATQFYTQLLTAFPDIHFDLTDIVVGPQGVCEEAAVTGTFQRDWLSFPATAARVEFRVVIFFPWDVTRGKFTGERVFVDGAAFNRSQ